MHYINMLKIWLLYHYGQTNQTFHKKQKCKIIIIITYIHYKIKHICKKVTQKKQDFLIYAFHQTPYMHSKLGA